MATRTPVEWRGSRVPHLYSRPTASGDVRFEAYRKVGGRVMRRVIDADSVSAAVRKLPTALAAIDLEAHTAPPSRTSFREWADDHLDALREKASRGELNSTLHVDNTADRLEHLRPLWDLPLAEITVEDVDAVIGKLTRARRTVNGQSVPYAASTIRSVLAAGHAVCARAVRKGGADRNVFALVDRSDLPRAKDGARARLSLAELHRLIDHADDYHRALIATLALTGARVGEVAGLTWGRRPAGGPDHDREADAP
jgi:integrase